MTLSNPLPDVSVSQETVLVNSTEERVGGGRPGSKKGKKLPVFLAGMLMAGLTYGGLSLGLVSFLAARSGFVEFICLVHSLSICKLAFD